MVTVPIPQRDAPVPDGEASPAVTVATTAVLEEEIHPVAIFLASA